MAEIFSTRCRSTRTTAIQIDLDATIQYMRVIWGSRIHEHHQRCYGPFVRATWLHDSPIQDQEVSCSRDVMRWMCGTKASLPPRLPVWDRRLDTLWCWCCAYASWYVVSHQHRNRSHHLLLLRIEEPACVCLWWNGENVNDQTSLCNLFICSATKNMYGHFISDDILIWNACFVQPFTRYEECEYLL